MCQGMGQGAMNPAGRGGFPMGGQSGGFYAEGQQSTENPANRVWGDPRSMIAGRTQLHGDPRSMNQGPSAPQGDPMQQDQPPNQVWGDPRGGGMMNQPGYINGGGVPGKMGGAYSAHYAPAMERAQQHAMRQPIFRPPPQLWGGGPNVQPGPNIREGDYRGQLMPNGWSTGRRY